MAVFKLSKKMNAFERSDGVRSLSFFHRRRYSRLTDASLASSFAQIL
jgi:hypothetical protein